MPLREILKIDDSPLARELRHAVEVLDSLHRFPKIPVTPVILTESRVENGAYNCKLRPPRPISVAISHRAVFPAITLIHEVGHMLDHLALNPIRRGFGSEHDALFDPLRKFWSNCRSVHKWKAELARKGLSSSSRSMIRYQLRSDELWARTYQQWVVEKSDDLLLQVYFQRIVSETQQLFGKIRHFYWDRDEVSDMMLLVDGLLFEAGLL